MKFAILIIVFFSAAWAFPKDYEELQFNRLYVDPLEKIEGVIPRIVQGHEVDPHSIPYQTYIIVTATTGSRWLCGGSLISPSYVLTAAHCVIGGLSADVYLGAHNVQIIEYSRVHIISYNLRPHEYYNATAISNDIGLIKLPAPVELNEYINVVALPNRTEANSYAGNNVRVSGWGLTTGNGATSPVLLEVNSTVMTNSDCSRYFSIVIDSHLCISGAGGVGSCNGDSGGPLVANDKQIGLVSYGAKGCVSGYPSVFSRITSFFDWLEENTDLTF